MVAIQLSRCLHLAVCRYQDRQLFDSTSLEVERGERVALIGAAAAPLYPPCCVNTPSCVYLVGFSLKAIGFSLKAIGYQ